MFNASDIEKLDYDFSGFYEGGPSGIVPEPSTEAISAYQLALSNVMDQANERIKEILGTSGSDKNVSLSLDEEASSGDVTEGDVTEEEKNAQIDKLNGETWTQRKHLLADLCQQQPSFDDISRLGHRVFMKFEDYCLGKWTPQAGSAATS